MKIINVSTEILDLEVEAKRSDAVQEFVKQETVFVRIFTEENLVGTGYTYTIGTGGQAIYKLLTENLLPRLIGQDTRRIEYIWHDLFSSTRATAPGAITSLALAAIDIALWDVNSQYNGDPLWISAGGFRRENTLYDTENGWLHLETEHLVQNLTRLQKKGWGAAKIKIGKPSLAEDRERLLAVREAVGDSFDIMVDANQAFTVSEAVQMARVLEDLGIKWFEEPLPADDLLGHVTLAKMTSVPIAVGETLYSLGQFQQYVNLGAASIIQVDVARVGGITPWLKTAKLAEANNLYVSPHFLMEIHTSLVSGIPNGMYVEHIPQLTAITKRPSEIVGNKILSPSTPGVGIDWDWDKIDNVVIDQWVYGQ